MYLSLVQQYLKGVSFNSEGGMVINGFALYGICIEIYKGLKTFLLFENVLVNGFAPVCRLFISVCTEQQL
jgi:hypothetical protein